MIRAMWSGASGMNAQQMLIDVMANNLANVSSTGFKKSRTEFEDLFYQVYKEKGTPTTTGSSVPVGIEVGLGTRPVCVQKIFTEGDLVQTNNKLDIAIEGEGFFQIMQDGNEVFTRDGAFKIDANGYIVNAKGDRLQPEFAIPSTATNVTIEKNGNVTCLDSGGNVVASGQIPIYLFTNPAGLKSIGGNSYVSTPSSGDPIQGVAGTDNAGTLSQGYLEMSNVDAIEEMINMIQGQRAYEINSKTIKTADNMLQVASSLVR
jgi:flagellar basal-body rod protein FlgG